MKIPTTKLSTNKLSINMLRMDRVSKTFTLGSVQTPILKTASASFNIGHTYALTGASGTGKSTVMHLLAGIETPDSGSVTLNGKDLSMLSAHERSHFLSLSLGLVFQQPYLIAELTVAENISIPGLIVGKQYQECLQDARELLSFMGLAHKADHKPSSLSGGQQQRVALARALFNKPAFLLADEPTGNLDVKTGAEIISLLGACQEKWKMGIIISTHDPSIAQRMSHNYEIIDHALQIVR